jgi:D-alanyl-D-alanine dipeptidase
VEKMLFGDYDQGPIGRERLDGRSWAKNLRGGSPMLDETLLQSPRDTVPATVRSGQPTGRSDDELREQVRARLAEGHLPTVDGVSRSHRGTGRPCIVCRRAVEPVEVEREVTGGSGVVLTAHEECYRPWREESRVWRDLVAVGESADRSGVTDRGRT